MKTTLFLHLIFALLFCSCGGSSDTKNTGTETSSSESNSSEPVVEQWENEISGRIMEYYYSDNYFMENIKIAICEQGYGSYYKYAGGGELSCNFQWHIENTERGGPILYLDGENQDQHYSYNLVMDHGIIYMNNNKYLRLEERANCN